MSLFTQSFNISAEKLLVENNTIMYMCFITG